MNLHMIWFIWVPYIHNNDNDNNDNDNSNDSGIVNSSGNNNYNYNNTNDTYIVKMYIYMWVHKYIYIYIYTFTLQETNISHLGKKKFLDSKVPWAGICYVSCRVYEFLDLPFGKIKLLSYPSTRFGSARICMGPWSPPKKVELLPKKKHGLFQCQPRRQRCVMMMGFSSGTVNWRRTRFDFAKTSSKSPHFASSWRYLVYNMLKHNSVRFFKGFGVA